MTQTVLIVFTAWALCMAIACYLVPRLCVPKNETAKLVLILMVSMTPLAIAKIVTSYLEMCS